MLVRSLARRWIVNIRPSRVAPIDPRALPPPVRMPLPTFLTVASLFLQAGAALIIACVFVGLKRRYWRPFLSHWTWSWLALAAYATLRAIALIVGYGRSFAFLPHVLISMASGVAGCLQLTWLLLGTYELT